MGKEAGTNLTKTQNIKSDPASSGRMFVTCVNFLRRTFCKSPNFTIPTPRSYARRLELSDQGLPRMWLNAPS